jgi:hypothetical protein
MGESPRGEKKMPCRKHDGEHDWRNCPDNKNRQPQSKSKKEKDGVRSLLGVVNFIKNQIPCRAEICEPITRLT